MVAKHEILYKKFLKSSYLLIMGSGKGWSPDYIIFSSFISQGPSYTLSCCWGKGKHVILDFFWISLLYFHSGSMNFGDLARLPFSELNRQLEHCFLILRFTQYIIFISIFFEIRLANVQVFHKVRPILETKGFKTKYSRKTFSYANALLPNVRAEENIETFKKQT